MVRPGIPQGKSFTQLFQQITATESHYVPGTKVDPEDGKIR